MENTGNQPRRFCRKCLLQDMDEEAILLTLCISSENLDADLKVTSELYDERLAFCRECDNLISGMCRVCGCFRGVTRSHEKKTLSRMPIKW